MNTLSVLSFTEILNKFSNYGEKPRLTIIKQAGLRIYARS